MSLLLRPDRCCLFTFIVVASYIFASWPLGAQAACPLDSVSFELITNIKHISGKTNVDIRLEERYSGEQSRGQVKLRARGLADYATMKKDATKLDFEAATFFYDSQENISLQYNDGSGTCKQVEPDTLMRAAGIYFKPADEASSQGSHRHLIGSARWLKYFCERRSELKADISGLPFTVRNVPSVRYSTTFTNEQGTKTEVAVYYREASLTQEERDSAMPDRIVFNSFQESVTTMLEISPVKYMTSDQEYAAVVDAEDLSANLELDHLLLTPVNCQALIFGKTNPQPIFGHDRIRRVSFSARVMREHDEYTTQVAYDGHLETMRVDLATPQMPIKCSKQIFNFYRNKMYHILEQAHLRSNLLLGHLLEGVSDQSAPLPVPGGMIDTGSASTLANLNGADSGASSACSSAPMSSMAKYEKHTLGELLLGSNAFMYLGRARVRGIRALVYAAVGSALPFWLEAPVDGGATPPNKLYRPLQYITHLFVSEVPLEHPDEDSQILMMQIYRMDMDCKFVYEKYTIPVYDFTWSLRALKSACGETIAASTLDDDEDFNNLADLFSLADRCSGATAGGSSGEEQDEHGHFELLLESVKPPLVDAASVKSWHAAGPLELNLATLTALQRNLNMMVDMLYGLETKLIGGGGGGGGHSTTTTNEKTNNLRLLASFNLARHSNESTRVAYVGKGYRMKARSMALSVTCFHQCFMLAAHRRHEVDLAYDDMLHYCYIGLKPAVGLAQGVRPEDRTFEINEHGNLRLYRTRKTLIAQRGVLDTLTDVHHTETKHVRLRDKRLAVAPAGCASVEFLIKRMHVSHLLEPTHRLEAGATGAQVKELVGFGLQEEQGVSQAAFLPPGEVTLQHEEALTLDQCEALCLASFKCRSISYCLRGARAECILSLVDLSAPAIAAQIKAQVQKDSSQKIIQVTLQVEPSETNTKTISLVKQPNCAIYNKQFLQYFERDESALSMASQQFVSLARVASVEECARTCFNTNLASLYAHNELLSGALARLEGAVEELASDKQADALQAVERLELRGAQIKDCKSFHFIWALQLFELETSQTLEQLKQFANSVKAQISFDEDEQLRSPEAGFCLYSMRPRKPSADELAQEPRLSFDKGERFEFDKYDFNMASLFEEEHGVRLRSSQLSSEEEAAYNSVRLASYYPVVEANDQRVEHKLDANSLEIVTRLVRRGENFQKLTVGSRQVCASICFKQINSLWPACRSFDLFIELLPNGHSVLKCALNSMTKRQLLEMNRTDLIDSTSWTTEGGPKLARPIQDSWHYEPKEGLLTGQWTQEEESAISSLLRQFRVPRASSWNFFHGELLFLVMATGLALGSYLGVILIRHAKSRGYLSRQVSRARGDSISSMRELDPDDHMDLPPIRNGQ